MGRSIFQLVLVLCLCSMTSAASEKTDHKRAMFLEWQSIFKRVYQNKTEEALRFENFAKNLDEINQNQNRSPLAEYSSDEFSDWSSKEMELMRGGGYPKTWVTDWIDTPIITDELLEIDWVSKGAVTKPTSQGRCGTCQSFSAIADIEGAWFLAGHPLVKLSEQELIDCGGGDGYGMKWVHTHGVATNEDVPLANHSDPTLKGCRGITNCSTALQKSFAYIDGVASLTNHNETNIKALLQHGPVSVSINASPLNGYKGGIINCTGQGIDHAVALVGYGVDNSTGIDVPFWKLKNSWGPAFGEGGYFRLAYGNTCLRGPCQAYIGSPPVSVSVSDSES